MLNAAEILADDFPQVRVDFFEIDGKLYFGEMTFTNMKGMMEYFSENIGRFGNPLVFPASLRGGVQLQ